MQNESTVGAFYLHKKQQKETNSEKANKANNEKWIQIIKSSIDSIISPILTELKEFDSREFATNLAIECKTEFVMKYVTAAIVMLASGKSINCDKFLDILFIDIAPLMGYTRVFMGYMSFDAMRLAMKNNSGKFNIVGFLRGIYYGLRALQEERKIKEFEEMYEDVIPIDLIDSCTFEYAQKDMTHVRKANPVKAKDGKDNSLRIGARHVAISLVGHIKNPHGNFTQTNTYIQKLEKCMSEDNWDYESNVKSKEYNKNAGTLTLRIGNDIYENCLLDELKATVATEEKKGGGVYDLKITAKLKYNLDSLIDSYEENGLIKINPNEYNIDGILLA